MDVLAARNPFYLSDADDGRDHSLFRDLVVGANLVRIRLSPNSTEPLLHYGRATG